MTATSEPPPPVPGDPKRVPRAGTFRQKRPVSSGAMGLRRGATFANRPQSYAGDAHLPAFEAEFPDAVPRLRRGASFVGRPDDDDPKPQLRRASRRGSDAEPPLRRSSRRGSDADPPLRRLPRREPLQEASPNLPRAGTFAYGVNQNTPPPNESAESVRRMSSTDKASRERRSCGMCGNCGTGVKAMPPWAPERLATMTPEQRDVVLREMQHKEEMGRLEAELRKKRVADMHAVSERLQARRSVRLELEADSAPSSEEGGKGSEEYELESVDLGEEERKSSRRGLSRGGSREDTLSEDVVANVGGAKRRERRVIEDCGECGGLEVKLNDLEEQLDVLRKVVKTCAENEEAERLEEAEDGRRHHGKGWMGKIASAYYGSSAAASEKTRLKEEVETLRRATDFLFKKLQTPED